MREHTYTKYRPKWCNHPPFESIDYCWGDVLIRERDNWKRSWEARGETINFLQHQVAGLRGALGRMKKK